VLWLTCISAAGWMFDLWLSGGRSHILVYALPFIALVADYVESALKHRVTLYPDGIKAEACLAFMNFCLGLRLIAIVCFLLGFFVAAENILLWIAPSFRPENVLWLLMLDLLAAWVVVSRSWVVAPMVGAGFGSIALLQRQTTPDGVKDCLKYWAAGDSNTSGKALLMPLAQTIWRNIFTFIPAYSVLLFVGSWTAFSLAAPLVSGGFQSHRIFGPLESEKWCWIPAAIIPIVCSLAHLITDSCYLKFVSIYPALPSPSRVFCTRAAGLVKRVFFLVGAAMTVSGALWLLYIQNREIRHFRADPGSLIAVLAGGVILCFSPTPVVRRLEEFSSYLYTQTLTAARSGFNYLADSSKRMTFRKPM
jgi:hypothetical protein